ncbi:putative protease inhibitor [Polyplosphaeria fusca]|uniref:Protease inhibitor n=1 Tax=Polyplosphaeria fusca TaxID=682080 RepID=A0A9P4RDH5_9PLEO|nr:putative protease inhibitor [Polyplosphaeria fusca]
MPAIPSAAKLVLDQTSPPPLRIHFPNTTVVEAGKKLSKEESKPVPTLSISSSIAKPATAKYVVIELDLDAPFTSMALLSPILHAIWTDMAPEGEPDADGFTKLTSSMKPFCDYAPPGPPPISGPHRYVFMVWEQPQEFNGLKVKQEIGFPDKAGVGARVRWNQERIEKLMNLSTCLGGNYFVV